MKETRAQAIENGERYYKTGKPCKYGHISKRDTIDGACYQCRLENNNKNRQAIRAKVTGNEPQEETAKPAKKVQTNSNVDAKEILAFLNEKTGRNYQPVPANISKINARLKEFSMTQLRQVIAKKCREWGPNEKMEKYLRPATLFNAEKCAQYVGELGQKDITHG